MTTEPPPHAEPDDPSDPEATAAPEDGAADPAETREAARRARAGARLRALSGDARRLLREGVYWWIRDDTELHLQLRVRPHERVAAAELAATLTELFDRPIDPIGEGSQDAVPLPPDAFTVAELDAEQAAAERRRRGPSGP
jgi:hypothetical protein